MRHPCFDAPWLHTEALMKAAVFLFRPKYLLFIKFLAMYFSWSFSVCTFQILGGCQGRRTGVGVTTVSNSLILGGWVTKVLKNGDKK